MPCASIVSGEEKTPADGGDTDPRIVGAYSELFKETLCQGVTGAMSGQEPTGRMLLDRQCTHALVRK